MTHRFLKSPFILATSSGLVAIVVDLLWVVSELALTLGYSTEMIHIIVRIIVGLGLISALGIGLYAIKLYSTNGYIKADAVLEKCHRLTAKQQNKRNKIFK